ncbi:alpha/beta fold hydrolase [Streptomyces profundus]|uniref:alpha/beta fold hydrolase n=1 Tax=Streptomyces profundus TaxID=2867410 RepID=UPI001D162444|nr:alpha/beta hydrolase [Streptomyces sp. MA3_2.13]UED83844.1 alpha/beta hydrolase [Streptomyces sp. MA3_2.13]
MNNFVLVPGAWLGAEVWDDVVAELRAAGQEAHALTLPGLAERSAEPAGQQAHVRAVVDEIERLDLRNVVLVGHSYSGTPVGQAALRIGDRLARVVFVDANVPADGEPFANPARGFAAAVVDAVVDNDGWWPPPPAEEFAGQGLTEEEIGRLLAGATPHPGASLTEPAVLEGSLAELPASYVKCLLDGEQPTPDVVELLAGESWRLVRMDTGHWPMFSQPRELARVLLDETAPGRG